MKYYRFLLIAILGIMSSSCRDDTIMTQPASDIPENIDKSSLSDDVIYLQQTDKTRMLYSFIYWDNEKNIYVLDLSEKDREILGIDPTLYKEANEIVNQLNTTN